MHTHSPTQFNAKLYCNFAATKYIKSMNKFSKPPPTRYSHTPYTLTSMDAHKCQEMQVQHQCRKCFKNQLIEYVFGTLCNAIHTFLHRAFNARVHPRCNKNDCVINIFVKVKVVNIFEIRQSQSIIKFEKNVTKNLLKTCSFQRTENVIIIQSSFGPKNNNRLTA